MKIPILAACGILAIAASIWCVKHSMDGKAAETSSVSPNAGFTAKTVAPHGVSQNIIAAGSSQRNTPQTTSVSSISPQVTVSASQSPLSSNSPGSNGSTRSDPIFKGYSAQPATSPSASGSALPPTAIALNDHSAASNADPGALELDPGVPVPAALLTLQEKLPPTVAAARQQLADSFVQDVNAALNQPGIGNNDAAVGKSYYQSLSRANEQYRALFGDAAYNQEGMRATMEAQAVN